MSLHYNDPNDDLDAEHIIPAASIGDTDLDEISRSNPAAAAEIEHLEGLMGRGEESPEEFLRLCQLLFDVGSIADAEYLLRRNLEAYDGQQLYHELFGSVKQEEYEAAIKAFESQFGLSLQLVEESEFLIRTFRSDGRPQPDAAFHLLSQPCEIRIGYVERDTVEADVILLAPDPVVREAHDWLLLHFLNGTWGIADSPSGGSGTD